MVVRAVSRGAAVRLTSSIQSVRYRITQPSCGFQTIWSSSHRVRFASSVTEEPSTVPPGDAVGRNAPVSSSTSKESGSSLPSSASRESQELRFEDVLNSLNLSNKSAERLTRSFREHEAETARLAERKREIWATPTRPRNYGPGINSQSLSAEVEKSAQTDNYRSPTRRIDLKLGPELGRQVFIDPDRGMDLAGALRMMNSQLAQNKLRSQSNQQKFHVRRGQRRKDLRIERWRKLFKLSFNATVAKIQRMREQGW